MNPKNRLGYLCAAPRVSTRPEAEESGARAHVLGVIQAFESLDWEVKRFIIGDRVPQKWISKGSKQLISSGFARKLAVDLMRLGSGAVNARRAWQQLGAGGGAGGDRVGWVYERFSSLQSLGWIFQQHGIPWILETNAPMFYEAKCDRQSLVLGQLARRLELKAYQQADVLVCVSSALKEIVVREASIAPEKVLVVPNGANTALFNPEKQQRSRIFKDFTLGFVGRLYPWQGLDLLLEVIRDLRLEGINICLVVVGDGAMRQAWQRQAQQLGIAEYVAFLGQVSWAEVPKYIAGFDLGYSGQIQLQIGKMYLSPLKLYEYMAMAKPAIASRFEDASRVIRDGETGFLFQAGNKENLKQVLMRAYNSWQALPDMGRKARNDIVTHHSWRSRVMNLIPQIESILEI